MTKALMTKAQQALLDAGAILPGKAASGSGHDTMTARGYRHPVLEQTVVRLVGQTLGPAEDLSMEFLGFEAADPPVAVGHGRRQALGFPAWALVNDPANGRHALALVKDMERLARVAKSKPGNAKDGYDALARRLGGAAPQFLPTFWEQAGRAFLAADNQRMAGTCFAFARRAEQVHGLAIDEDRLREVHLEFAFAGALTAKMLTEFARGVVDRLPSTAAYELIRTLAVQRVAGGLAPQATIADELAKLARAAGLDPEEEAQTVAAQLITFPAMLRAPMVVWKGYRKALAKLAKRDPAVGARLLELVPDPPGYRTDGTDEWLDLLAATGAQELLVAPKPGDVSAGRWLERLVRQRMRRNTGRSAKLLALVERMVPRLIAEGRPVELWQAHSWRPELDLVDLCVAKGVPIDTGSEPHGFHVEHWANDPAPGARDLSAIAADERLRPILSKGVRAAVMSRRQSGNALSAPPMPPEVVKATFGAAGVAQLLVELLTELSADVREGTVLSLDDTLTSLAPVWSPTCAAIAPQAFQSLTGIDVAAMLRESLRAGLMAEFTWPQYEQTASTKMNVQTALSWPNLAVYDNRSAHILKPDGTAVDHVYRYPPADSPMAPTRHTQTFCHPVGDDLFVRYGTRTAVAGYWLSDPDELFETTYSGLHGTWGTRTALSLRLPGGGVTRGDRPWHPGDTKPPEDSYAVASDGTNFWRCEQVRQESGSMRWEWIEFDPATGDKGRASLPAFFARPLPAGGNLRRKLCELRPAPPEFSGSPLGWRDGLVGWRVAKLEDGSQFGEAVDGRTVTWQSRTATELPGATGQPDLLGALRMPGDDTPRPMTDVHRYGQSGPSLTVWTADGRFPAFRAGTSLTVPPPDWWHALTPRDPRGSAALRAASDGLARKLMEAATGVDGDEVADAVKAKLAKVLPEVTDATLREAIAALVARAGRLRRRLDGVGALLDASGREEPAAEVVLDSALRTAWQGLVPGHRYYYGGHSGSNRSIVSQVLSIGKLLAGNDLPGKEGDPVPAPTPVWSDLIAGPGALALRAASPVSEPRDRDALRGMLAALAESGLTDAGDRLRVVELMAPELPDPPVQVLRSGKQVTVVISGDRHWHSNLERWQLTGFQLSGGDAFTVPKGMTAGDEVRVGGWSGGQRLAAFVDLLAANGPAPWRPESVDRLAAATGMTRPEAALLLAGLPGVEHWEANFLSPQQRELMGLTMTQARVARDALRELSHEHRVVLLDAAMPSDPAALWEHGPDVEALARVWIRLRGTRVAVPEELLAEAARFVPKALVSEVIQGIAGPTPGSWLTTDGKTVPNGWYRMDTTVPGGNGTPFEGKYALAATYALAWLGYRLPWGDPIRAALPAALDLIRQRLRNPDLLMGMGSIRVDERPNVGPALVAEQDSSHGVAVVHLKPAKLSGPDDPAMGFVDEHTRFSLRLLLSGGLAEAVGTPDGAQGCPHDPAVSVPDMVKKAAKKLGLQAEPAGYYLQLLALPDPTDRHVLSWNGWKPAELKAAQKALTEAGLVMVAKRERAGRPVFLPGGWLPLKSPSLPMESWKASLYLVRDPTTLVLRPVPELFRNAWDRIESGDTPRYHDLKEAR